MKVCNLACFKVINCVINQEYLRTERLKHSWQYMECPFSGDMLYFPSFRMSTSRVWGPEGRLLPSGGREGCCVLVSHPGLSSFSSLLFPKFSMLFPWCQDHLFLRTQRTHYSRLLGEAGNHTHCFISRACVSVSEPHRCDYWPGWQLCSAFLWSTLS